MDLALNNPVEYTNYISAEWYESPNECPAYDPKQSDGEAPVMLKLWGMRSTLSLPLLPGPLWPGEVASDRVLSMCQIEPNCNYTKLNFLKLTCFFFPFNCV